MRGKINIKSKSAFFTVIGFTFLLLLSPCKVRNYIQSELGIPQTEVTNKSQLTISASDCKNIEVADATLAFSKRSTQHFSVLIFNDSIFDLRIVNALKKSINFYTADRHSVSSIPLYILYQNFKAFL